MVRNNRVSIILLEASMSFEKDDLRNRTINMNRTVVARVLSLY